MPPSGGRGGSLFLQTSASTQGFRCGRSLATHNGMHDGVLGAYMLWHTKRHDPDLAHFSFDMHLLDCLPTVRTHFAPTNTMKHITTMVALALLTIAPGVLGGCAAHHEMRTGSEGKVTVCRECYDQAVRVWDSGGYAGARWVHAPSPRVRVEHQCASCKSTMVVHTDDGHWMIQCPTCAPEGVLCDKCLPGDGAVRPASTK